MNIYCFGDSNTYGFDPRSFLGDRYPAECRWTDILAEKTGRQVINDGMNGRCIPKNLPPFSGDTDLLIVMLGSNDILQGLSLYDIGIRMRKFMDSLEAERILLISPPSFQRGAWIYNEKLIDTSKLLSNIYRDIAQEYNAMFLDADEWGIDLCFDGVHFTEHGHKVFANRLYDYLLRVI